MKNIENASIAELKEEAAKTIKAYMEAMRLPDDGWLMEFLSHLLFKDEVYDENKPYALRDVCLETLAILSDPAISAKLPKYIQPTIGQNLLRLHQFFDSIDHNNCHAVFALYAIQDGNLDEIQLKRFIKRYSEELKEIGGVKY